MEPVVADATVAVGAGKRMNFVGILLCCRLLLRLLTVKTVTSHTVAYSSQSLNSLKLDLKC